MALDAWRRECDQLRILLRDSVRRVLHTAMLSRDGDPIPFALWSMALVATPPWMFAANQMVRYVVLKTAPLDVIERTVLGHRLFFVLYGMLAAALLSALIWDAVFTDRADQEILGALPVRARTVVAARLIAVLGIGVVFSVAIALPGALVFGFVATTHPALGVMPLVIAGHLTAMTLGCLFVLCTLLTIRGALALVVRDGAAQAVTAVVQLVAVLALVEIFFFLLAIQPPLVSGMLRDDSWTIAVPPVWFTALYAAIVGTDRPAVIAAAQLGLVAVSGSFVAVVGMYLISAPTLASRVLETLSFRRASVMTSLARTIASILLRTVVARAVLVFALVGVARNRRHRFILATYLGLAIATAMVDLLVAGYRRTLSTAEPHVYLLSLPLAVMFFAVIGFRAAFAVPTDLEANWPFRLKAPSLSDAVAGTRAAIIAVAVVPVVVSALVSALLAGWPPPTAAGAALLTFMSGLLLVECALLGWLKVPLTCAHEPSPQALRSRPFAYAVALNLFAFVGANLQFTALQSATATLQLLAALAAAIIILRGWQRAAQKHQVIEFEARDAGFETLNLSEALH